MKKSKGFTLIELLAVIVILAIIALIAAPVVLGIIDDARESAAKDSALGLISAAKLHFAETLMGTANAPQYDSTETTNGQRSFSCNKTDCSASVEVNAVTKTIKLGLDGTVPDGSFTLSDDGKVTSSAGLTFNGKYCFKIEDNKITGKCI